MLLCLLKHEVHLVADSMLRSLCRFVVLHVFLTPVPSSFVRPHAQGSLAVWDCEGLVLSPLSSALVVLSYVVAGPVIVVVLQVSSSWSALVSLVTWVSVSLLVVWDAMDFRSK